MGSSGKQWVWPTTGRPSIDFLLEALEEAPGGINPKVRIALKLVIEHLANVERKVAALEARAAALEKVAHAPLTDARAGRL